MGADLIRGLTTPALALGASLAAFAAAAAPPPGADPNSPTARWFGTLRQPHTDMSCCSIADCRETEWRARGGSYQAVVGDGTWEDVPPEAVLSRSDNPTGRAVVCWTPSRGIMCFIRGTES